MSTLTQSLFGSEVAETGSSWSGANDSPTSFFPNKQLSTAFELFDLDRHSQSPSGYSLRDLDSPNCMRVQRKMVVHGIQQNTTELQRAQIRSSRKRSIKSDPSQVDVVRRTMCTCDYLGCHKAFRRNEHLKRHKQTFHGEGPNRFSCEFCCKDQFNRQDNLNNHRKLHARLNSRNRGVEFIPAAVPIIEREERNRKRRAPSKSKTAQKSG
ncbi:related to zinc finger protein odd-paired-like (opl) [Fusarium torulosum]|uniref:Related to zinc finger protein odd-paired-like (Opl) n=1 Tax=Fusarium torulosum TaxID=33205 RepID=A0AAE8MH00_9HYPO|nr:related to zinc finger protein odd-paired-like (opl) [Fusarium torulosum]